MVAKALGLASRRDTAADLIETYTMGLVTPRTLIAGNVFSMSISDTELLKPVFGSTQRIDAEVVIAVLGTR